MPVTASSDDPAYRAIRHLTTVLDDQVIVAERLSRERNREGRERLALLAKMQSVLSRQADKLTDGHDPS